MVLAQLSPCHAVFLLAGKFLNIQFLSNAYQKPPDGRGSEWSLQGLGKQKWRSRKIQTFSPTWQSAKLCYNFFSKHQSKMGLGKFCRKFEETPGVVCKHYDSVGKKGRGKHNHIQARPKNTRASELSCMYRSDCSSATSYQIQSPGVIFPRTKCWLSADLCFLYHAVH